MFRSTVGLLLALAVLGATPPLQQPGTLLPSGWRLAPPAGAMLTIGTMPQGIAISPDGRRVAIAEGGAGPAGLRLVDVPSLGNPRFVKLKGAFGRPVWLDDATIAVAGANDDAIDVVDAASGTLARRIGQRKNSWPVAIALSPDHATIACAGDGDGEVALVRVADGSIAATFPAGQHPSGVAFSLDGKRVYVASRAESVVRAIDVASGAVRSVPVGLHPAAIALDSTGTTLFVAAGDDDELQAIDTATDTVVATTDVRQRIAGAVRYGMLPNAIAVTPSGLYVTYGGLDAVAHLRYASAPGKPGSFAFAGGASTGWYPSDVAAAPDGTLYVVNGKGELARPNPQFNPFSHRWDGYIARQQYGSLRTIPPAAVGADAEAFARLATAHATRWSPPAAATTVIRPHGPIAHVIYIIKENRSYDQVLGDVAGANGDPSLAFFGARVTPNQHAIARRFGVFDNAYVNSEVSADGHNWTDAAIANDYTERFWPASYSDRRDPYDYQNGVGANVPHAGFLWDAAKHAGITYRDYGEDVDASSAPNPLVPTDHPSLQGHYDPHYVGWNLSYSDLDREAQWAREFQGFVRDGNLPALEIVYLPNDHTASTAPGKLTPQAYVAQNDLAVGRLVAAVSHSRYWTNTAIFALEDDAQTGPDHVSDQRSTFYVASAYARGGVDHTHYSTASVLATIERLLGLEPMSLYDATAQPMYDAFATRPSQRPFDALPAATDLQARNAKTAYNTAQSAHLDLSRPDAER